MKIAFINTNLHIGGSERTVEYLANSFCKKCNVDVISIDGSNEFQFDERVNLIKFNVPDQYGNFLIKIKLIFQSFWNLYQYLRKTKPDVIVCILCKNIKYIKIFQKIFKFKIVVSERTNPMDVNYAKYIKKADGVIFQTERAKNYYSKKIQKKSVVIQNAIGNPLVSEIKRPQMPDKKITALGRVVEEKDYKTLIDAFCIVYQKYPEYRLAIFGDRPSKYSDMIHQYVSNLPCANKINIYPVDSEALREVAKGECYVLSSVSEGMPNALMEAMAVGMPCVATDCNNGPAELIENGENGILVPIKSPQIMADAIIKIIEDKEFSEKISSNAKKIRGTNSIEKISEAYFYYISKFGNRH